MLSGRDALHRMDETLRAARRDLERMDERLGTASRALTENKLAQARAVDGMAKVRLDAARRGEIVAFLESATREAEAILAEREVAVAALDGRIADARQQIERLEAERTKTHSTVDEAARTLAEREAKVQEQLAGDEVFRAQLERSREADAVAASALEKAELAQDDRQRNGKPFESSELFMYLWRRGYGTPAYSANPLARLLDGWVARLSDFREARANYWMLLEIPKRLAEHADQARAEADAELDRLQDIEHEAAIRGEVPAARDALSAAEAEQDTIDGELAAAEDALATLEAERTAFRAGSDDYLRRALRAYSAVLERRDIDELRRLAGATVSLDDDAIVDELLHLRRQYDDLNAELANYRAQQDARLARIRDLEAVRRNFKSSRYDDIHSRFSRGDEILEMIAAVIGGAVNGGTLWDVLRRYQRYADAAGEWPDFGSGGLGVPRRPRKRVRHRPPSWHWPGQSGRRGGGGFNLPRPRGGGGRRGGGGFRTGGGF